MKLWQATQETIPNLDNVPDLMGCQLWQAVGGDGRLNEVRQFDTNGRRWHVWRTMGKGQNYHQVYVHIRPDDEQYYHYRGQAHELVGNFKPA